jgi:hypothetical protein
LTVDSGAEEITGTPIVSGLARGLSVRLTDGQNEVRVSNQFEMAISCIIAYDDLNGVIGDYTLLRGSSAHFSISGQQMTVAAQTSVNASTIARIVTTPEIAIRQFGCEFMCTSVAFDDSAALFVLPNTTFSGSNALALTPIRDTAADASRRPEIYWKGSSALIGTGQVTLNHWYRFTATLYEGVGVEYKIEDLTVPGIWAQGIVSDMSVQTPLTGGRIGYNTDAPNPTGAVVYRRPWLSSCAPANYRVLVQKSRQAITPPDSARTYNAFPVSCRLLNGDILVGYVRANSHHTDTTSEAVVKRSTDNGVTWGPEIVVYDAPSAYVGIQGLGQSASGRVFATLWTDLAPTLVTGAALINYSDDNGDTWSTPVNVTSTAGFTQEGYGAGPVVQAANGDLLFTVEGNDIGQSFNTQERSVALRSTDNGANWGSPVTVASGTRPYYETKLVRLPTDRILAIHRTGSTGTNFFTNYSDDNGATWSTPLERSPLISGPSTIVMESGLIVMAGRQDTSGRAVILTSSDNAESWARSFLDDQGVDTNYATPVDLLNGKVLLLYAPKPSGDSFIQSAIGQPVSVSHIPWVERGVNVSLIDGLTASCASGGGAARTGTARGGTGNWMYEGVAVEGDNNHLWGLFPTSGYNITAFPGDTGSGVGVYQFNGFKYINGVGSAYIGSLITAGTVVGVQWLNQDVIIWLNGVSYGVMASGLSGNYYPAWGVGTSGTLNRSANINLGYASFLYPISGSSPWL